MRVVQNQQMSLGEIDVSEIVFDPRSGDDIPQILRGLQHIYARLTKGVRVINLENRTLRNTIHPAPN